jgi:hypothetical protein
MHTDHADENGLAKLSWDEAAQLSSDAQTAWLRHHMKNWDKFVQDLRASHEQIETHRAAGNTGPPPGSLTLEEYRQQRALHRQA